MPGSKYTIQFGVAGVQSAVAAVNKVRDAQHARAQMANAERQFARNLAAERKAAEESLPPKKRIAALDAERIRNNKRLEEAVRKLQQREARGVQSPFLKSRVATLKLANQEIDKQLRKVRQLQREQGMGGRLRGFMGGVGGRVAGALGVFGLASRARTTFSEAGTTQRQAGTAGVSAEFLQEFQFAGQQFSITGANSALALRRLTRRIAEARDGTGVLAPQLEKMGISLFGVNGEAKSTEKILFEYADAIAAMKESGDQTLATFKAFDSEGSELVNVLKQGADGLREYQRQARESGAVMENDVVDRLAAADAKLVAFSQVLKVQFANALDKVIPFFFQVKNGFGLIADAMSIFVNSAGSIVRQLIRNPFGLNAQLLRMIGNRTAGQLAAATDRAFARQAEDVAGLSPNPSQSGASMVRASTNSTPESSSSLADSIRLRGDSLSQIGGFMGNFNSFPRQMNAAVEANSLRRDVLRKLEQVEENTRKQTEVQQRHLPEVDRNTKGLK